MKTPETKLSHTLRNLLPDLRAAGKDIQAQRAETAAMRLDYTALTLGARGARVKTLGVYYTALEVYRSITGHAYED